MSIAATRVSLNAWMDYMTTRVSQDITRLSMLAATVLIGACSRDLVTDPPSAASSQSVLANRADDGAGSSYQVVYLVADTDGFNALRIDPNLVNGWGLAITSNSTLWVSSNGPGLAVNYDGRGRQVHAPITIPARESATGGTPSGVVVNNTDDFRLSDGRPAQLLFASEDGIVSAWNGGPSAVVMARSASSNAVYKGLAIARVGDRSFVYATNFRESRIDVYDGQFKPVGGAPLKEHAFVDQGTPAIPADYGPFGITNLHGKLFVTYAKHLPPENKDDLAGPGNGFVSVFKPDGSFVERFASNGALNSPWGVTVSGPAFGRFRNAIIINNFGDGHINAFARRGAFLGQLQGSDEKPLVVDGIWSVLFPDRDLSSILNPSVLYFAAGPDGESHGTFGYIQVRH